MTCNVLDVTLNLTHLQLLSSWQFGNQLCTFCQQVSSKMGVSNRHVRNIVVWGEHGETAHVDAQHAQIQQLGQWNSLATALHDDRWLRHDLVQVRRIMYKYYRRTRARSRVSEKGGF